MSERPKSRKRHIVNGNVAEIKKSEEGLGLGKIGEATGFLKKMIKRIRRGKDND